MASKLNNPVTRETEFKVDNRNIIVTLNKDNTVTLKQKGLRGNNGKKDFSLNEIWYMYEDNNIVKTDDIGKTNKETKGKVKIIKQDKDEPLVNLNWLRSQNAISALSLDDIVKFDMLIKTLIDDFTQKTKKE